MFLFWSEATRSAAYRIMSLICARQCMRKPLAVCRRFPGGSWTAMATNFEKLFILLLRQPQEHGLWVFIWIWRRLYKSICIVDGMCSRLSMTLWRRIGWYFLWRRCPHFKSTCSTERESRRSPRSHLHWGSRQLKSTNSCRPKELRSSKWGGPHNWEVERNDSCKTGEGSDCPIAGYKLSPCKELLPKFKEDERRYSFQEGTE